MHPRERIQAVDPEKLLDADAQTLKDSHLSVSVYNMNKRAIRKHLCNTSDPKAAIVRSGECNVDHFATRATRGRLAALHAEGKTECKVVRGYRLVSLSDGSNSAVTASYTARSEVVIDHGGGNYECFSAAPTGVANDRFVFVPSSRVHTELSDDQILSGYFLLGSVVGGPAEITSTLLRLREQMSHFDRRRLCGSPEEAVSGHSLAIRKFPGFARWQDAVCRLPKTVFTDASIAFGFPFREVLDEELEAMFQGGDLRELISEYGTVKDFIDPKPPWKFERERWLPGVEVLHQLTALYSEGAQGPCFSTDSIFFPIYARLELEYCNRLTSTEYKLKREHACRYLSDFR